MRVEDQFLYPLFFTSLSVHERRLTMRGSCGQVVPSEAATMSTVPTVLSGQRLDR